MNTYICNCHWRTRSVQAASPRPPPLPTTANLFPSPPPNRQEYVLYDLNRAKTIARNAAFLESMGLSGNGQKVNMKADNAKKKAKAAARRKRKQKPATPPGKERRSSRVSKEPVLFEALPADAGHYISDDEEGPRKPRRMYVEREVAAEATRASSRHASASSGSSRSRS